MTVISSYELSLDLLERETGIALNIDGTIHVNSRHRRKPGGPILEQLWTKLTRIWNPYIDFNPENVDTSKDNMVPAPFAELIAEHSALDMRLYEFAVDLFRARLTQFPDLLSRYEAASDATGAS